MVEGEGVAVDGRASGRCCGGRVGRRGLSVLGVFGGAFGGERQDSSVLRCAARIVGLAS